jgi:hypothetical protein
MGRAIGGAAGSKQARERTTATGTTGNAVIH